MKQYNKQNISRAKQLRKNMTPWERKLWYEYLRNYPVRFQRQKAIGEYIVDFYCAKAKLVIELDGSEHYEEKQQNKDALRTENLKQMDLRVVRICNRDIDKNFRGVCEHIDIAVRGSLPQSAALTAPSSEEAFPAKETSTKKAKKAIYALGFFDGVHLGHQALLRECSRLATERGCIAAAVTFDLPPSAVLRGQQPNMINTSRDREALLRQFGMDSVLVYPATTEMLTMSWQDFLRSLLENGAEGFVCGADFRFGHNGEGTAEKLTAFCDTQGLACVIVPEQKVDGEKISSTRIRALLEKGDVENANRLMGHPHTLTGTVVAGRQLGRTIGVPTANLLLEDSLLTPAFGVYACTVQVDGRSYVAVTNIGTRPTVDGQNVTVEPWILDFDGDLYGREISLQFHKFLRPEEKFPDLASLKAQIQKDAAETYALLK